MKNKNLLYVRTRTFDDRDTLFWNQGEHAWGTLSRATVYTQEEVDSFEHRPDLGTDHAVYTCRIRQMPWFVPGDGEWLELPDFLKLKTPDEWLADIQIEGVD